MMLTLDDFARLRLGSAPVSLSDDTSTVLEPARLSATTR
jgi:hypothetical protein